MYAQVPQRATSLSASYSVRIGHVFPVSHHGHAWYCLLPSSIPTGERLKCAHTKKQTVQLARDRFVCVVNVKVLAAKIFFM